MSEVVYYLILQIISSNERGRLLLIFADYFNVCPVNLLSLGEGPLVTHNSFGGKYRSTIDYIFLPVCKIKLSSLELLTLTLTIRLTINLLL